MSTKSPRDRAVGAALRRSSKASQIRVTPIASATRLALGAWGSRLTRGARPSAPAQPVPQHNVWRIETLEPKLLLSADAIPAVHLVINDPVGGVGNTYQFYRGDGADRVEAYFDATVGKTNTLQFEGNILPAEIVATRVIDPLHNNDNVALRLSLGTSGDSVTVGSFFLNDDPSNPNNPIQRVRFVADGTVWNINAILAQVFKGTSGGGHDSRHRRRRHDHRPGRQRQPKRRCRQRRARRRRRQRVLDGGPGNNLYLFGKGDGQETIASYVDATPGKTNTLQFKAGVAPSEVTFARVTDPVFGANAALQISITGTTDKVTVNGFMANGSPANPNNGLQQVVFADGTTWDISNILVRLGIGTDSDDSSVSPLGGLFASGGGGDDRFSDSTGAETFYGGDGNDYIQVFQGNDLLIGGRGDDFLVASTSTTQVTLDGGPGEDLLQSQGAGGNYTYLFGRGDGRDTVNSTGGSGTLQMKAGVAPADVLLKRTFQSNSAWPMTPST